MKFTLSLCILLLTGTAHAEIYHAQGEMAGEVSETSAILHSRLTASKGLVDGDVLKRQHTDPCLFFVCTTR